jgi:hypothetical protein
MARHKILVGDVAERTAMAEILCSKCERRGRTTLSGLFEIAAPLRA